MTQRIVNSASLGSRLSFVKPHQLLWQLLKKIRQKLSAVRTIDRGPVPTECLVVRASPIHGNGLFTLCRIRKGTLIIEYVGERISKDESTRRLFNKNPYIFELDDQWDLDGNVPWNLARFMNHSCRPNCEARLEDGRILIYALRDIEPGEELTFNYGYDLENYREYPCRCGAPDCVGYIVAEELFEIVRRKEALQRALEHRPAKQGP